MNWITIDSSYTYTIMSSRLELLRSRMKSEFLGGPMLSPGSTEECLYVQPSQHIRTGAPYSELSEQEAQCRRTATAVAPSLVLSTLPPPPTLKTAQPHDEATALGPSTHEQLQIFASHVRDAAVDLPWEVCVRTRQGQPRWSFANIKPMLSQKESEKRFRSMHESAKRLRSTLRSAKEKNTAKAKRAALKQETVKRAVKRRRANKAFLRTFS